MLDDYKSPEPLILSSGIETSIMELVKEIVQVIGFSGEIIFDSEKPDGQFRKPSDTEVFFKLNPGFEFTSLTVGLESTIKWFVKNYPNVRA